MYTRIYIYIWVYMGKFDHDLTVLPNPGIMANKGNHPQMAARFRLVKYYNLPRYSIYIYVYIYTHTCVYVCMGMMSIYFLSGLESQDCSHVPTAVRILAEDNSTITAMVMYSGVIKHCNWKSPIKWLQLVVYSWKHHRKKWDILQQATFDYPECDGMLSVKQ